MTPEKALRVVGQCSCGETFLPDAKRTMEALRTLRGMGGTIELPDAGEHEAEMHAGMLLGELGARITQHVAQNPTHRVEVFIK